MNLLKLIHSRIVGSNPEDRYCEVHHARAPRAGGGYIISRSILRQRWACQKCLSALLKEHNGG